MRKKYKLKVLQIETTNICNGKCKFCIHNDLKEFGTMSDRLFLKILLEASGIKSLKIIVPMLLGEPFCDPMIIPRMKLINRILPKVQIHLFTNGSLLTKDKITELQEIENLTMHFSLNGINKETRFKLMGLNDYEHVIEMIKLYKKTNKPFETICVQSPDLSKEELKDFLNLKLNSKIIPYKNWSGDKFKKGRQTFCNRAICQMPVMYDGRVNLCCMEYGKVIFGDLNKQTIKEIWESPHRQMYCEAHSFGKFLLGPCANCTKA